MPLSRIVMRLARNPGGEFAGGDDHRGYTLTAPLTADGHLDVEAWSALKDQCHVRHFAREEDPADGRLGRRGQNWFFDFEVAGEEVDEAVYRLGSHTFGLGDYVTVNDHAGQPLTYKVTEVTKV